VKWKYFIPHEWESDRTTWEDVHLLPDDSSYEGEPLWLTVFALGGALDDDEYTEMQHMLQGKQYHIKDTDMVVAADDFSKAELIEWVGKWFSDSKIRADEFVEVGFEEFDGMGKQMRLLGNLRRTFGDQGDRSV